VSGSLVVDHGRADLLVAVRSVDTEEEDGGLACDAGPVGSVGGPSRHLRPLRRVVDDVEAIRVGGVELVRRCPRLRVPAEERVAGCAGVGEVTTVASSALSGLRLARWIVGTSLRGRSLRRGLVDRVVRHEVLQQPRPRERRPAVGGLHVVDGVSLRSTPRSKAPEDEVDVAVPRHGDVGELHVGDRLRDLDSVTEGHSVIRRTREMDADATGISVELRPREVNVVVTASIRVVVGLDRGLVVELPEQVRRRRTSRDDRRSGVALSVVDGAAARVHEAGNPDVTERFRR
jgi:hypothetical protein